LRGAEARPLQGRDLLAADRGPLGAGEHQGVEQRGHGRNRQGRGNRLHGGRFGRHGRRDPEGISSSGMAQDRLREGLSGIASRLPAALGDVAFEAKTFNDVGLIRPMRPDRLARVVQRYVRLGASPALGSAANAITAPDGVAIIDEAGSLTCERTHPRSKALARALQGEGVEEGDGVAIMCRNHRYFIEATMACAKLGAVALYLNPAFAGPQLSDVMERERPSALIYDQEFTDLLTGATKGIRRFVAWEEKEGTDEATGEQRISGAPGEDLEPPSEHGRYIILTSGTTGTPKGAQRSESE